MKHSLRGSIPLPPLPYLYLSISHSTSSNGLTIFAVRKSTDMKYFRIRISNSTNCETRIFQYTPTAKKQLNITFIKLTITSILLISPYRYDPGEVMWTEVAPMLKSRSKFCCCPLNGKIYVCGKCRFQLVWQTRQLNLLIWQATHRLKCTISLIIYKHINLQTGRSRQ